MILPLEPHWTILIDYWNQDFFKIFNCQNWPECSSISAGMEMMRIGLLDLHGPPEEFYVELTECLGGNVSFILGLGIETNNHGVYGDATQKNIRIIFFVSFWGWLSQQVQGWSKLGSLWDIQHQLFSVVVAWFFFLKQHTCVFHIKISKHSSKANCTIDSWQRWGLPKWEYIR